MVSGNNILKNKLFVIFLAVFGIFLIAIGTYFYYQSIKEPERKNEETKVERGPLESPAKIRGLEGKVEKIEGKTIFVLEIINNKEGQELKIEASEKTAVWEKDNDSWKVLKEDAWKEIKPGEIVKISVVKDTLRAVAIYLDLKK